MQNNVKLHKNNFELVIFLRLAGNKSKNITVMITITNNIILKSNTCVWASNISIIVKNNYHDLLITTILNQEYHSILTWQYLQTNAPCNQQKLLFRNLLVCFYFLINN